MFKVCRHFLFCHFSRGLYEYKLRKNFARVVFYVYGHYHVPTMYLYSSFSPFILSPLVEGYVDDIDKS